MPPIDAASASSALLTAAMGGLLCLTSACGSSDSTAGSGSGATASGTAATDPSGPDASAILATDAGASIAAGTSRGGGPTTEPSTAVTGDTPSPRTECSMGVYPSPQVLTATVIATMTKDTFAANCTARNGIYETQPNCGGSNSCRGMSYDTDTQTLRQHDCRATNSCAGFSCVVCD